MKVKLLLLFLFVAFNAKAQDSIDSNIIQSSNQIHDSIKYHQDNLFKHAGEITIKSNNESIFEFLFPSIIALIVGLMAYTATILSAKKQRTIIEKQIESNRETIKDQISTSLRIAELDFRKTVLSSNRQAWINELRDLVSDLISLFDSISLRVNSVQHSDYQKILFLITKIELMLNPEKDSEFIKSVLNLQKALIDLKLEKITYKEALEELRTVKEMTKVTLKTEWERVKKGE